MNFLAHVFLSGKDEDLLLGNFMADFISNNEVANLSPAIRKGVELHRIIDSFTDQHEMVRKGTKRLRANHGKYAPVVIDILYDNVLAKNWSTYEKQTLAEFSQDAYLVLFRRSEDLPEKLSKKVPFMVKDNFLAKYGTIAGLTRALSSMDRRTKFPSDFVSAIKQLEDEWDLFNEEFNAFFPEMIERVEDFLLVDGG